MILPKFLGLSNHESGIFTLYFREKSEMATLAEKYIQSIQSNNTRLNVESTNVDYKEKTDTLDIPDYPNPGEDAIIENLSTIMHDWDSVGISSLKLLVPNGRAPSIISEKESRELNSRATNCGKIQLEKLPAFWMRMNMIKLHIEPGWAIKRLAEFQNLCKNKSVSERWNIAIKIYNGDLQMLKELDLWCRDENGQCLVLKSLDDEIKNIESEEQDNQDSQDNQNHTLSDDELERVEDTDEFFADLDPGSEEDSDDENPFRHTNHDDTDAGDDLLSEKIDNKSIDSLSLYEQSLQKQQDNNDEEDDQDDEKYLNDDDDQDD